MPKPSHKVLLTIGDCNTLPTDLLPKNQYLATYIQKNLGNNIELKNYGQPMATTREGIAILKDYPLKPDYVVINFGLVDSWITSIPSIYISYYPFTIWRKYPLKWLKMIKKKLRHIKKIVPRGNVVPSQEYIKNIHTLIDQCRVYNKGAKIIIWTTPHAQNNPARNIEIDRYNTYLREIAKEANCTLCESANYIDFSKTDNYLDDVHLSSEAAKNLGKAIAETLQNI